MSVLRTEKLSKKYPLIILIILFNVSAVRPIKIQTRMKISRPIILTFCFLQLFSCGFPLGHDFFKFTGNLGVGVVDVQILGGGGGQFVLDVGELLLQLGDTGFQRLHLFLGLADEAFTLLLPLVIHFALADGRRKILRLYIICRSRCVLDF